MATKVKPSRIQITWTPQAWQVPVYVDADTFQWWDKWAVSNTAYGSWWDWQTAVSPSQNAVYDKIKTIDDVIPSTATSSNKLTDKNYVDDSINQVAAYYITKNAQWDAFGTKAELTAATTFYSWWAVRTPTRNDYCVVLADETHSGYCTRYSYQGTQWEYQYTVNESSMTQAQLDALNSWITAAKVTTYDWYASTISWKQDKSTSWSWAPTSTPTFVWQQYIDTTNDKMYFATWTSSSSDWTLVGSWSWMWDVTWPASSTDSDIVLFDWGTWKVIKDSSKKLTDLVQTSWNQSIAWTKTFTTSPVVPNKTAAVSNTWTAIATEAQVYLKQDKLTAQTVYTSQWTATKVPTITTNSLWQVTNISETSITFPVTSVNGSTWAVTGLQTTGNLKTDLTDNSDTYYPSQKAVKTAVDAKQNALATQTAYTTKWTSTKVPTISTNTLWQVTAITETSIAFPVTSVWGSTWAVGLKTLNSNSLVGTGDIAIAWVPSGWNNGDVLTNVSWTATWQAPSGWGGIENDTTWTTSVISAEWAWTVAEFNNITPAAWKVYFIF